MFKKKFMAAAAAVASLALVVPAFSLSATAASGDVIDVGGKAVKLVSDFEKYDDGMRVGKLSDKDFTAAANTDAQGFNFTIKSGVGAAGSKALSLATVAGVLPDSPNCQDAQINLKKAAATQSYAGDTDFVFWIDCTKNANADVSIQAIIDETDYNTDGTVVMGDDGTTPKSVHKGFHNSTYYTLADDSTDWVTVPGATTGDNWSVTLPNTFKGYVRVPVDQFVDYWGEKASDGAFNLKNIMDIGFYYYFSSKDDASEYALAIDNVGFVGDYALPTTTEAPTTETTVAPTEVPTESTAAPTENGTATTLSNATTAAPTQAVTTTEAADTTTTTTTTESPKTGDKPIAAALAVAVAFAGVLIAAKKKNAI